MALRAHMSGEQQLFDNRTQGSPHRSHDALEPDEQHRRCQVDRLVRLLTIALGRLARTQERQVCALQIELHEVRHRQRAVLAEVERTLERLPGVLSPMAGDMHEGCGRENRRRLLGCGHGPGRGCILDARAVRDAGDFGHLCPHTR
jgi:hypothetical protein